MEAIKLTVQTPEADTDLGGLDALIGQLERIDELQGKLSQTRTVKLGLAVEGIERLDAATSSADKLTTALRAVGDTRWSAQLEAGGIAGREALAGIAVEAQTANAALAEGIADLRQMEARFATMGTSGANFADKMARARQAIEGQRAEVERLQAAAAAANRVEGAAAGIGAAETLPLRAGPSTGVEARRQLVDTSEELAAADTKTAVAARESGAALDDQRKVAAAKIGVIEKLTGATERLASADEKSATAAEASSAAMSEAARAEGLMSERVATDERGKERVTRRYRTGAGSTRTESGKTATDETDYVEQFKTRFERMDADFTSRRTGLAGEGFASGSKEQVALLDQEAAARRTLIAEMAQQGLAEDSLAIKQSQRANQTELAARTAEMKTAMDRRRWEDERQVTEFLKEEVAAMERRASVERGAMLTDEQRITLLRAQAAAYRELAASIQEAGTVQGGRGGLMRQVQGRESRVAGEADNLEREAELARQRTRKANIDAVARYESGGYTTQRSSEKSGPAGREATVVGTREVDNLKEVVTLTRRWDAEGKALVPTLSTVRSEVEQNGRGVVSLDRSMLTNIATISAWAAGAAILYQSLHLIEAGFSAIIDGQGKLVRLESVFHGSATEAMGLRDQLLDLAAVNGRASDEAEEAGKKWLQLGLSQRSALEATRDSLVEANVGEVSAADSTKQLQTIMAGYRLEVGELRGVLGGLNEISHDYNVTNKDLLEGTARGAGVARQAGLAYRELMGIVGASSGQMGRPGAEMGNAVRSLSMLTANPSTQKKLESEFGFQSKTPAGDLKNLSQLLNELYERYQALSEAEQREMLVRLGGRQQGARVQAILDSYIQGQVLAIKATRDLGSAERESDLLRGTAAGRLTALNTEFQRLAINLGNVGGGIGASSQLTAFIETLGNIVRLMAHFPAVVAGVVAVLALMGVRLARVAFQMSDGSTKGNILLGTLNHLRTAWNTMSEAIARANAEQTVANRLMGTGAAAAEGEAAAVGEAALARGAGATAAKGTGSALGGIGKFAIGTLFSEEMLVAVASIAALELGMKGFNALMESAGEESSGAARKLSEFNREVERTNALLEGAERSERLAGTLSKTLPSLSARNPDQARQSVAAFADVAYTDADDPGSSRRNALREELTLLVEEGRIGEAQAKIDAVRARYQRDKVTLSSVAAAQNRESLVENQQALSLLEREITTRRAAGQNTVDLEKQRVETAKRMAELRGQRRGAEEITDDEEETDSPSRESADAYKRRSAAQKKGIDDIFDAVPAGRNQGRVGELDREMEKIDARKAQMESDLRENRARTEIQGGLASVRLALASSRASAYDPLNAEHTDLYRSVQDAQIAQKNAPTGLARFFALAGGGTENLYGGLAGNRPEPKTSGDLDRDLGAAKSRLEEFERSHSEQLDAQVKAREELDLARAALAVAQATNTAKNEEIAKNERSLEQERESLRLQRDKYAALKDALTQGERRGREESSAFAIGRNETERGITEAAAIGGRRGGLYGLGRDPLADVAGPFANAEANAMTERGNIDLARRPVVRNADGTISTVLSMSFGEGDPGSIGARGIGQLVSASRAQQGSDTEVLVPKIRPDGTVMSDEAAQQWYGITGQHLGKFSSVAGADRYAQRLHEQQERMYVNNEPGENLGGLLADPARRYQTAVGKGDGVEQNRAAAEIMALGNRLTEIQVSLEERRYRLQAEIVNERRKENEEASRSLAMAGREDQLRAALLKRYEQRNGGFSSGQFQFLEQNTKEAVRRFTPDALPPELESHSKQLEGEYVRLAQQLGTFSKAVSETTDYINKNIKVSTAPLAPGNGTPEPPQLPPVNLTFHFTEQATAMAELLATKFKGQVDAEIAGLRALVLRSSTQSALPLAQAPGADYSAGN